MPFTTEQFLEVFAAYNLAVYPAQLFLASGALAAIFLAFKASRISGKFITAVLGFFWLWMGAVYHLLFFSRVNRAALVFSLFFILQAAVLFYAGVLSDGLSFHFRFDASGVAGILLIVYALIFYPLLAFVFGHTYPQMPTFGLPCPTTIFTFGLLLWTDKKSPWYVLPIPFLWSLVGFSAAILLGMWEDFGLPAAALVGTTLLLCRNLSGIKKLETPAPSKT